MNENEVLDDNVLFDYCKDTLEVELEWDEIISEAYLSIDGFDDGLAKAIETLVDKRDDKEARRFFIKTRERVANILATQFIKLEIVPERARELMDGVYVRLCKKVLNREGI